jgi:hypothetical protein
MRSARNSLVISLAFLLAACDEMSRSHYASANEARRDAANQAFIPSALPDSAFDISEEHDLDTNTGEGSFRFAPVDTGFLRAHLQSLPASTQSWGRIFDRAKYERQGFEFCRFEKFCIAVNWSTCEAHFWFNPRA